MTNLVTLADLDPRWRTRWSLGPAMSLPVNEVFIHHTVAPDTGNVVRDWSIVHDYDQRKFGKISYSWGVQRSISAWVEGQTVHRGAHTIDNAGNSFNGVAFGIAVQGNFENEDADDDLIQLLADGIREFVEPHLKPGYRIRGHRDVFSTACCGRNLYARLPDLRDALTNPTPPPTPLPPIPPEDIDMYAIIQRKGRGDFLLIATEPPRVIALGDVADADMHRITMDEKAWNRLVASGAKVYE